MRLLLDTCVWLWMLSEPARISPRAVALIQDRENGLFLSVASIWEIAIKHHLGKLPLPEPPHLFIPPRLVRDGISDLAIESRHACHLAVLPDIHRDPFDRMLVAQAVVEKMILMTADPVLAKYDAEIFLV